MLKLSKLGEVQLMSDNLQIEYIEIDQLVPYSNNARTHSKEQIDEIIRSIRTYGYVNPVAVNSNNVIVCGHGRVEAAKSLGLKKLPCIKYAQFDAETLRKGYTIADNQLAIRADWDYERLKEDFLALEANAFDPTLTGFMQDEIDKITGNINFDAASEDDQGKLDELSPKYVACPNCGREFDANANTTTQN